MTSLAPQVPFPPTTPDLFGPIVGADDVRQAVRATLQTWSQTYINELAYRTGRQLKDFRSFAYQYEYRTLTVDQSPACWVTVPGTRGQPERQGSGPIRVHWVSDVSVVVNGGLWAETADLVALYLKAVRTIILQHGSLQGFAESTMWLSERYAPVGNEAAGRTLGVGVATFEHVVANCVNWQAGPKTVPIGAGTTPGPTVASVNVTLTKETLP